MKKTRLLIALTLMLGACSDPCEDVECLNDGYCLNGVCVCEGFVWYGEQCENHLWDSHNFGYVSREGGFWPVSMGVAESDSINHWLVNWVTDDKCTLSEDGILVGEAHILKNRVMVYHSDEKPYVHDGDNVTVYTCYIKTH